MSGLPIIDMSALYDPAATGRRAAVAVKIKRACEAHGFFYLVGHGIGRDTFEALEAVSRRFFALPEAAKAEIAMPRGGRAWRGWFPVGGELTSGRPDLKEGLYFGSELAAGDPRVRAGLPLHGPNLWPDALPELRYVVLSYMAAVAHAAAALLEGVSLSLGLPAGYFEETYTRDPTVLFRIFHYPAQSPAGPEWEGAWGVGEHTDYGLLTLLAQDRHGGLQVKSPDGWIEAPPIEGALVCNIGDMLERLTGGRYRSTPHRVRNVSGEDRLSFPLFFDPAFDAPIRPLPLCEPAVVEGGADRWDGRSVHLFQGRYGDYLLEKVSRVFPALGGAVLP